MVAYKSNSLVCAVLVFFLSFLYFAVVAGKHQIFTRGEGREAIVAQSMFDSADYVLPLRNGSEIPSKPPLFHWIASAVASFSGSVSEFDIRFPSVIATATALFVSVLFYSSVVGSPIYATLLTLLIFSTTFESLRGAAHGRVDALFAATISFACFALFSFVESFQLTNKAKRLGFLIASVAALVLAGLAKGPAGVLIPGFICAVYVGLQWWNSRSHHQSLRILLSLAGVGIIAILGLAVWYYLAYKQRGTAFLQVQLYDENLARLFRLPTSGAYSESLGHEKPFYFSLIYLVVGFLPWSLLLPMYGALLYRRIKERRLFEDRFYLFALVWVATFLIAVTISSSKRSVYFLPCYPALAYLVVFEITASCELRSSMVFAQRLAKLIRWTAIFLATLLTLVLVALLSADVAKPIYNVIKIDPFIVEAMVEWKMVLAAAIVLVFPAIWLMLQSSKALLLSKWPKSISLLAGGVLLINLVVALSVAPFLSELYSPKSFLNQIASTVENEPLYQYKDDFYAAIFYARRPLPMVKDLEQLQGHSGYILASEKSLNDFVGDKYSIVAISDELAANQRAKLALIKIWNR